MTDKLTKTDELTKLGKFLEEKENKRKKPINTEMYWWLSLYRSFFIGDEYKISLEKIDMKNKSVKIKIVNLKTKSSEVQSVKVEDPSSEHQDFLDAILNKDA